MSNHSNNEAEKPTVKNIIKFLTSSLLMYGVIIFPIIFFALLSSSIAIQCNGVRETWRKYMVGVITALFAWIYLPYYYIFRIWIMKKACIFSNRPFNPL